MRRWQKGLAAAVALAPALSLAACGEAPPPSDDEVSAEVEDFVDEYIDHYNSHDMEQFMLGITDNFVTDVSGNPRTLEDFRLTYLQFQGSFGDPPIDEFEILDKKVISPEEVEMDVQIGIGQGVTTQHWDFLKLDGDWVLDGLAMEQTADDRFPAGATVIDITEHEFHFSPDVIQVPAGDVVLRVDNQGVQPHLLDVFQLDPGVPLERATEVELSGQEARLNLRDEVTVSFPVQAGNQMTLAMTDLEPGTYYMACFVNDPADNTAHILKNMVGRLEVV